MKKIIFYGLWLVVIYYALRLAGIALAYFSFEQDYHFLLAKRDMLGNMTWVAFFYVHLFFGVIATLAGFPLFFSRIIPFRSRIHRYVGKAYIIAILFFTAPTGLYLSFYAEGGFWASIGFFLMSLAWILPTYLAYQKIIAGNIVGHYRWIIRSYAMTLSGVTLRLFTPIGSYYLRLDEQTNFIASSFVWIFNIILAEIILYANREQQQNLAKLTDI
jgi:hypothetical protein